MEIDLETNEDENEQNNVDNNLILKYFNFKKSPKRKREIDGVQMKLLLS